MTVVMLSVMVNYEHSKDDNSSHKLQPLEMCTHSADQEIPQLP